MIYIYGVKAGLPVRILLSPHKHSKLGTNFLSSLFTPYAGPVCHLCHALSTGLTAVGSNLWPDCLSMSEHNPKLLPVQVVSSCFFSCPMHRHCLLPLPLPPLCSPNPTYVLPHSTPTYSCQVTVLL